jgi:hypothetical protein
MFLLLGRFDRAKPFLTPALPACNTVSLLSLSLSSIYIYIYALSICLFNTILLSDKRIHIASSCLYICIYVCICMYICYMYVYMYVCICMYVCMYVYYMYVCMYAELSFANPRPCVLCSWHRNVLCFVLCASPSKHITVPVHPTVLCALLLSLCIFFALVAFGFLTYSWSAHLVGPDNQRSIVCFLFPLFVLLSCLVSLYYKN